MAYVTEKPSEKRVNVIPVRARIVDTPKESDATKVKAPKPKGSVSAVNFEDVYYFPGFNQALPEHAGLGMFIVHTDSSDAPEVEITELRELLNDDLSRSKSIADLLRIVFPKYISSRNFLDAVDAAVVTLRNYYGTSTMQQIVNRFEDINFLDLKWLTEYGTALNLVKLTVRVFDFDGNEVEQECADIARWSMIENYAILEMVLDTGAKVHYYITPNYLADGNMEYQLIRADQVKDGYNLYVDVHGNLHVLDFRTLFGSFMQYDISYASARYFCEYHRSPMANLGTSGEESANTLSTGSSFALAHIDKTLHSSRQDYLDSIASGGDNAKTINATVTDIEQNEDTVVHPTETAEDTKDL